jgi:stage IV sporulation protein FB
MIATGTGKVLFRIAGIPVAADAGAIVLLALILVGWSRGGGAVAVAGAVLVAVVAFFSVIAHELGHAFAVRRLGYGKSEIRLGMMGGVCIWRGRATHRDRVLIALAGPAVSLVLGGIGLLVWKTAGPSIASFWPAHQALMGLMILNLAWGIFNLLPIHPMDGGQALRSGLAMKLRWRQAVEISLIFSIVCSIAVAVWAVSAGMLIAAILLGFFAWRNMQEMSAMRSAS